MRTIKTLLTGGLLSCVACGESGLTQLQSAPSSVVSGSTGGSSTAYSAPRPGYSCSDTSVTGIKVSVNASGGIVVSWDEMGIDGAGHYELDVQRRDPTNIYVSVLRTTYRTHLLKQDVIYRGPGGHLLARVRLVTCNATHVGPWGEAVFSLETPTDVGPDLVIPPASPLPVVSPGPPVLPPPPVAAPQPPACVPMSPSGWPCPPWVIDPWEYWGVVPSNVMWGD